jgi:hypothetical protein
MFRPSLSFSLDSPKILNEQQADYTEKVHKGKGKGILVHVIIEYGGVEVRLHFY